MRGRVVFELCRTVLAVCALYALTVQDVVGAIARAGGDIGELCAPASPGSPAPGHPADRRTPCCLAACMAAGAAVASPAPFRAPPRTVSLVVWHPAASIRPSAPVALAFRARGPPPA